MSRQKSAVALRDRDRPDHATLRTPTRVRIGNWKWSNTSSNSALRDNYTVNELNQYVLKENNTFAVGGVVANDAAIQGAARLDGLADKHWGDNVTLENWLAACNGPLKIYLPMHLSPPMKNSRAAGVARQTPTIAACGHFVSQARGNPRRSSMRSSRWMEKITGRRGMKCIPRNLFFEARQRRCGLRARRSSTRCFCGPPRRILPTTSRAP